MFAECDNVICSSLTLDDVIWYNDRQEQTVCGYSVCSRVVAIQLYSGCIAVCGYSAVLSGGYSAFCGVAVILCKSKAAIIGGFDLIFIVSFVFK